MKELNNQLENYNDTFDEIVRNLYNNSNVNKNEALIMSLVKIQLKTFQDNTHPVLNYHDFSKEPKPVPNMGVIYKKTMLLNMKEFVLAETAQSFWIYLLQEKNLKVVIISL
jgi:hypothetical protein